MVCGCKRPNGTAVRRYAVFFILIPLTFLSMVVDYFPKISLTFS